MHDGETLHSLVFPYLVEGYKEVASLPRLRAEGVSFKLADSSQDAGSKAEKASIARTFCPSSSSFFHLILSPPPRVMNGCQS